MKRFLIYGFACCFLVWLIHQSVWWLMAVWEYLAIGAGIICLIWAIYHFITHHRDWR